VKTEESRACVDYGALIGDHPVAKVEIDIIRTELVATGQLVQRSARMNSNGAVWRQPEETTPRGYSCASTSMARRCLQEPCAFKQLLL
jgi:hypothetical protein